jgi:hypothetical protein
VESSPGLPIVYPDGSFLSFSARCSDDKHARMVEEIADFEIYTVLADTDSFFSNDCVFDSF